MHAAIPSEGGHIEVSCSSGLEDDFLTYLMKRMKNKNARPGYEIILCDKGISHLYDFIASQKGYSNTTTTMIKRLASDEKLKAIQTNYHLNKACKTTLNLYMTFYARACTALALMSQCYSGLFITDMLVLKNTRSIEEKNTLLRIFMTEFETSETRSAVIRKIPVYLITSENVALNGCYNYMTHFLP